MSDETVKHLIQAEGTVRVFEMEDGSIVERSGGSVSWRNNNPGNLKFEYAGSADKTVRVARTKDKALANAKQRYEGVVGLDQWGNAVFENYEAGRAAKIKLLKQNYGNRTVEDMLKSYSKADYSGAVNHRAQTDFIYGEGERQGVDLRNKAIGVMSDAEVAALADGIKGFEGWRMGETRAISAEHDLMRSEAQVAKSPDRNILLEGTRSPAVGELQTYLHNLGYADSHGRPLTADNDFGQDTRLAVEAFQRDHGLSVDGVVGSSTWPVLRDASRAASIAESSITFPQMAAPDLDAVAIDALQQQLQTLGMTNHRGQPLPVTGTYDEPTRIAVTMFQKEQGLPGTGVPDPATRALIEARATIAELQHLERGRSTSLRNAPLREDVQMPAITQGIEPGLSSPIGKLPQPTATTDAAAYPNDVAHPRRTSQQTTPEPGLDDPRNALNPDHALYATLKQRIPDACEERLVQFTAACHMKRITADKLEGIYLDETANSITFAAKLPLGVMATVDLKQPLPTPEQATQQVQHYDMQRTQQAQQMASSKRFASRFLRTLAGSHTRPFMVM
jgi:peptidoglycan hydrolase-like protein with peptidoglycan-binding domain